MNPDDLARHEMLRRELDGTGEPAQAGWRTLRGKASGPLFTSLGPARKGNGRDPGAAAQAAAGGDQRGPRPGGGRAGGAALQPARALRTLQKYDDNRQDLGGDVARRVAEGERAA
jgi:hypothetical protein